MTDPTRRMKHGGLLAAAFATLMLVGVLVACSDGNSPTTPPAEGIGGSDGPDESDGGGLDSNSGNSTGVLEISMKDAPIDDVSELQVYITGLKVKPAGRPVERLETNAGLYDLLRLTNGTTEILVKAEVEVGTYQFIEILLDEDQSYVVEATSGGMQPLQIASEKVKPKGGPFEVREAATTAVLFDFDAEKSLKQKGNGAWLLKPFLKIVKVTEEGGEGLEPGK